MDQGGLMYIRARARNSKPLSHVMIENPSIKCLECILVREFPTCLQMCVGMVLHLVYSTCQRVSRS
ncbi:hypothetical protein LguiA_017600 [Lonicera macranthoides]